MGWGSGTANFTYKVTVRLLCLCEIFYKASLLLATGCYPREFHTSITYLLEDFNLPLAGNMAVKRSAALVFLISDNGEGITVDGTSCFHLQKRGMRTYT